MRNDNWSPYAGTRIGIAWEKAISILGDGEFHDFADLIPEMASSSSLLEKTVSNLLHRAVKLGILQRKGNYHKSNKRGRLVKFIQPVPSAWIFLKEKPEKTPEEKQNRIDKAYRDYDPIERRYDS